MVPDRMRRVGVGAHLLPHLRDLVEVVQNTGVPRIAAAFDVRARERQELDVGVVQLEQRVQITPSDRLEGELHDLHIALRHSRAVSRLPRSSMISECRTR
jgi:hypothetical protein